MMSAKGSVGEGLRSEPQLESKQQFTSRAPNPTNPVAVESLQEPRPCNDCAAQICAFTTAQLQLGRESRGGGPSKKGGREGLWGSLLWARFSVWNLDSGQPELWNKAGLSYNSIWPVSILIRNMCGHIIETPLLRRGKYKD
jgi:hypothetical protein